jgi:primosomal protein N' (replication factor Y)
VTPGTEADLPLLASVAPPVPVGGLFDYLVPERLAEQVVPGVRAMVPFGGRSLSAMVVQVERRAPPPGVKLKALQRLVDQVPLASPDILELGRWMAHRLGCSVGEALDAALPRAARDGRSGRMIEEVRLAMEPRAARPFVEALQARREKQARALRILADRGGVMPTRELMNLAHVSRSPIESLAKVGHVTFGKVAARNDPLGGVEVARRPPLELTAAQQGVFEHIVGALALDQGLHGESPPPPKPILLHGVTGSGKTEVYLQALDRVVAAGRQGIVLVPEISLTPQTTRRFRERFDRVAVLHSHLTDAERNDQWRAIRRGEADVVVGARSAVFAPVPKLGLIVLDEEHETSFKQGNVPRYHAREVAVERARTTGALVLLGTATPSLEAFQHARDGVYERLELNERVAGGRTPEVHMVDLSVEERRKRFAYISDPLRAAMDDVLARHGQVILFLNRRGWAPVLLCRTCRKALHCPDCAVSMTMHQRANRILCHYCGHEEPPPDKCRDCGQVLAPLGFGTEKVEEEVKRTFPHAHVARMDSDTMSGRGAHEKVLDAFGAGKIDVLVGTQMIAKGLDFPNALLVGVLCADSALFLPDYRASERTFQLLAQVTGRTGRGPKGGRVVVQAYDPKHVAIKTGVAQDYMAFARHELPDREALGYPPFGRIVRVVVQGPDERAVIKRAAELGRVLRAATGHPDAADAAQHAAEVAAAKAAARAAEDAKLRALEEKVRAARAERERAEAAAGSLLFPDALAPRPGTGSDTGSDTAAASARASGPSADAPLAAPRPAGRKRKGAADVVIPDEPLDVLVMGPAPAPIPRINKQHRVHLVAKCADDAGVEALLTALEGRTQPVRHVRVLVDVDPMGML